MITSYTHSDITAFFVIIVLFIFFMVFAWIFIDAIKKYSLISRIGSNKQNKSNKTMTALKGMIHPTVENKLISPLSGKDCYWYEYSIEQYNTQKKSGSSDMQDGNNTSSSWQTIKDDRGDNFFLLNDGVAQVLIATHGAEVVTKKETWQSNTMPNFTLTSHQQRILNTIKTVEPILNTVFKKERATTQNQFRFNENRLDANQEITVFGYHQNMTLEDIDNILLEKSHANKKMIRAVSQKEDVLKGIKNYLQTNQKNSVDVISMLSPKKNSYVISSLSDKDLKRHYFNSIIWTAVANVFIILVAGFFILHHVLK